MKRSITLHSFGKPSLWYSRGKWTSNPDCNHCQSWQSFRTLRKARRAAAGLLIKYPEYEFEITRTCPTPNHPRRYWFETWRR